MNSQVEQVETLPECLAGAVSKDAIRHLMIRSDLNRAIYKAVRDHVMSNMSDADDNRYPYPLVDLMSDPAPADIGSGEMEMISLVDEIEAAVASLASQHPVLDEREVSAAALERAIAKYMQAAGVPLTEFDPSFVTKMVSAMMVSFHKYGRVADAYPLKFNAADDVRARMAKYRQTGNKHFLADAANFAMIEAMHPAPERYAVWGDNDAANSPGRTTASGHRLVQEDNSGNRIMGETILHHPSNLGGPDDVA